MNRVCAFRRLALCVMLCVTALAGRASAQSFVLSGTVYGGSSPLAGTRVDALTDGTTSVIGSSTSDAAGKYSIPLATGTYDLRVTPPAGSGYGTETVQNVVVAGADASYDVVLAAAGSGLSGTLRGYGGQPVANATIYPYTQNWQRIDAVATTDASGKYSLPLGSGTFILQVQAGSPASPYAPERFNHTQYNVAVNGATTVDIRLPVGKVAGTVTAPEGGPMPGAAVELSTQSWEPNAQSNGTATATADGSGRYEVLGFTAGQHGGTATLIVRPPAGIDLGVVSESLAFTGDITRDVELKAQTFLSGVLSGYAGRPVGNVTIYVYTTGWQFLLSGATDADGVYRLPLGAGTYILQLNSGSPNLHAPGRFYGYLYNVTISGSATLNITLPLARISGTVTRSDGSPLTGADVRLETQNWAPDVNFNGTGSATTDEKGQFEVLGFTLGQHGGSANLLVTPPADVDAGAVNESLTLTEDLTRTIALPKKTFLSGLLSGYAGQPVANATVYVYTQNWQLVGSTITDANGRYSLPLGTGTYIMGLNSGFPSSPHAPERFYRYHYKLQVDGTTTVDVALPVVKVGGTVTDSNGAPVPGVSIAADSQIWETDLNLNSGMSVVSDADGRYDVLAFAGSGQTNVVIQPPGTSGFAAFALSLQLAGDITQRVILQRPDLSPPQITAGPLVVHLSDTSVSVSWTTNEASTSVVDYGIGALQMTRALDGLTTSHTVTLLNLQETSTYQFRASSADAAGNGPATSSIGTFATQAAPGDITPPLIEDGPTVVFVDQTSAIVQWRTDEPASSRVDFGLSPALGSAVSSAADVFTQRHSLALANLTPETTYYAQVTSADPDQNTTSSSVFRFTTLAVPDTTAPEITEGPTVVSVTDTEIAVSWTTNEPATSGVSYNDGLEFDLASDDALVKTHEMTLSGLRPSTEYRITVSSTDVVGNGPTLGTPITVATMATPDTSAPEISNVQVTDITTTSAVISWTTNEVSTSTVDYGRTSGAPDNSRSDLALTPAHAVTLTGLADGATYYFTVGSADATGNAARSDREYSFATESAFVDQPPTSPGPITAPDAPTRAETFDITWGASTDDVGLNAYEIVRNGSAVAVVSAQVTTYSESGLTDGQYSYRIRAIDTAGHVAESEAVVVTVDRTAPQISVPGDLSSTTTGASAVIDYNASAFDLLDTALSLSCSPVSGASFPVGKTTVVCGATDHAGNNASASFIVTVTDAAPPTVTVPADMRLEATSTGGAMAEFTATADDLVDGPLVPACNPSSGATFALGTTAVTCEAVDEAGNRARATFNVTVVDTTAPKVTGLVPSQTQLWSPNHQMVPLSVKVSVSDLADAAPVCRVSGISSSEPIDGLGDGDTDPDWTLDGGVSFSLRAERSGNGGGRVYTIAVECADRSGNSTNASTEVTVPRSQRRK